MAEKELTVGIGGGDGRRGDDYYGKIKEEEEVIMKVEKRKIL